MNEVKSRARWSGLCPAFTENGFAVGKEGRRKEHEQGRLRQSPKLHIVNLTPENFDQNLNVIWPFVVCLLFVWLDGSAPALAFVPFSGSSSNVANEAV
jgi:hypothetical protein